MGRARKNENGYRVIGLTTDNYNWIAREAARHPEISRLGKPVPNLVATVNRMLDRLRINAERLTGQPGGEG